MDNITHSLVGLASSETLYRAYSTKHEKNALLRWCLWGIALFSNNLADFDSFLTLLFRLGKLNGLLQHRGYTHTFLFAFFEGFAVFGVFYLLAKKREWVFSRVEKGLLLGVSLLGFFIHIILDSLNSYGVHPLWPFSNQWFYGDILFIVEPSLWVLFTPVLFFATDNKILRGIFGTVFFTAIGLSWFSGFVVWELALVETLCAFGFYFFAFKFRDRFSHLLTWIFFFCILGGFSLASRHTRTLVDNELHSQGEGVIIHDIALSPMPLNPLCWTVVTVESLGPLVSYKSRRGFAFPFPELLKGERCLTLATFNRLGMEKRAVSATQRFYWISEEVFNLDTFKALAADHCGFQGFLRFSRVPRFKIENDSLLVSDKRFEARGSNFSTFTFPLKAQDVKECPLSVPWEMPRTDLLR